MAEPLLNADADARCPHGAKLAFTPSQARVRASGKPLLTMADVARVADCPFKLPAPPGPPVPDPCLTAPFVQGTKRVFVNRVLPVLFTATGALCIAPLTPPLPPTLNDPGQRKVKGA